MFTARRKNTTRRVEIFPDRRECPLATRLFWQATPTDPQGSGTHKDRKWPPRYTGKPQDNIGIKNAVRSGTASPRKLKTIKKPAVKKKRSVQSRNRIMSDTCSSHRAAEAQDKYGLYPRGLKQWGTWNYRVQSEDVDNRPRLHIFRRHGYSMFNIAVIQKIRTVCQGLLSGIEKRKKCAIPEQDNVRHLFKP